MDQWEILNFIEKGWTRRKILNRIQVSGNLLPLEPNAEEDKKYVQYRHLGVEVMSILDKKFPKILKNIPDPPVMIFTQGEGLSDGEIRIGVVGSRKMSERGKRAIEKIVPELIMAGVVTVSGLAIGVDTYVHEMTLESGGRTIAVLPGPLDDIYPVRNRALARRIIESGGTLVSEYPLGVPIEKKNFLERNRLVAGLSEGILVIEAGERSGSIATPNYALDQGKEVWCVPAREGEPNSEGIINLINDGAKEVNEAEDVLNDLLIIQ